MGAFASARVSTLSVCKPRVVSSQGESGQARQCAPGKPSTISHQACQEHGWFLPHGRGGVERGGGARAPPWAN
eukprot:scaffold229748_cov30-Tisochrysis_lutea.AAC.4